MAEWQQEIIDPIVGMNTSVPPSKLKPGMSPKLWNVVVEKGRVVTDYGLADYGDTVVGQPRLIYKFRKKSGVTAVVLITNSRIYKWANGEWQYLKGPQSTTVSGQHTASDTTIDVVDDAGFADGDPVGIMMDNGKQHRTTVNGTPAANVITITDGVPTGRTFEDGAVFLETPALTGASNSPVTADTFPADDVMIFTNGKDNVKRYDGTDVVDVPNLVTAVGGSNCYADVVLVKDNKVCLFNMNENGTDYPQRVRWSATGDYTDWTTANDAGYEDLYDSEDPIIAAKKVGNDVAVYRDFSIYLMRYVGTTALIYFFSRVIHNDSACSAHAVLEHERVNVFMGKQGFYMYSGGAEFTEIGQELWEELFGEGALFSKDYAYTVFSFYFEALKEYLFFFPGYDVADPVLVARYSAVDKVWTLRKFGRTVFHIANAQVIVGVLWSEATGNWEDNEWTSRAWNDISLQSGTEQILLCGRDGAGNWQVFSYGSANTDDDGVSITGEVHTHEMFLPEQMVRINRVIAKAKGSSIAVEYSEDQGGSWTSYGTLTPGSSYAIESAWKQLVLDEVMFRFTGTEFGLDRVVVEWKPESRY